ncbi:MAG: hypothetical protein ACMG57_00670 [Candidatus Dojkabacteria bacterium]
MHLHIKTKKAFSLVELVLAMGLFSALVLAMSGGFAYAIQSTQFMATKNKAIFIADEGLEALRSIRNEAFANLTVGTFGLAQSGNKWILSGSSDTVGGYTRNAQIISVDSTTKQVLVTVTWTVPFASSVSYNEYLTDWQRVVQPAWSTPTLASTVNLAGNLVATKVAVSGNYAFVVRNTGASNFSVVDISNEAAPSAVFNTTLTGNLTDIFISGNYAYITSDDNAAEFRIMSIATPTAPNVTTTFNMSGNSNATGVFVVGTKAYVTRLGTADKEFNILDVTNPLVTPTLNGTLDLANNANALYVSGNYAYVATSNTAQELGVINITNPAVPTLAGGLNLVAATTCSAVNGIGTTILLGCTNSTLTSVNAANPAAPALLGSYATGGIVNDIILNSSNTLAFIATASATLEFQAIDLSSFTTMTLRSSLNTTSTLNGLAFDSVRDNVVGVSSNTAGEFIIIKN